MKMKYSRTFNLNVNQANNFIEHVLITGNGIAIPPTLLSPTIPPLCQFPQLAEWRNGRLDCTSDSMNTDRMFLWRSFRVTSSGFSHFLLFSFSHFHYIESTLITLTVSIFKSPFTIRSDSLSLICVLTLQLRSNCGSI